jgi:hypothetical protein
MMCFKSFDCLFKNGIYFTSIYRGRPQMKSRSEGGKGRKEVCKLEIIIDSEQHFLQLICHTQRKV